MLVKPLPPMHLGLGALVYADEQLRPFLPTAAQDALDQFGRATCETTIGIAPDGKVSVSIVRFGARTFTQDDYALSDASVLMSAGPRPLVRYLGWLKNNVVAGAAFPTPGVREAIVVNGMRSTFVPMFIGPEFEDDVGVVGLDHPEFLQIAISFISGRVKPLASRKVLYVADAEWPGRIVRFDAPNTLVLRRTFYSQTKRPYGYSSTEALREIANLDDVGVVADRLIEMGEIDP